MAARREKKKEVGIMIGLVVVVVKLIDYSLEYSRVFIAGYGR